MKSITKEEAEKIVGHPIDPPPVNPMTGKRPLVGYYYDEETQELTERIEQ